MDVNDVAFYTILVGAAFFAHTSVTGYIGTAIIGVLLTVFGMGIHVGVGLDRYNMDDDIKVGEKSRVSETPDSDPRKYE